MIQKAAMKEKALIHLCNSCNQLQLSQALLLIQSPQPTKRNINLQVWNFIQSILEFYLLFVVAHVLKLNSSNNFFMYVNLLTENINQSMKPIQVNGTFKEANIPIFKFSEKNISISFDSMNWPSFSF